MIVDKNDDFSGLYIPDKKYDSKDILAGWYKQAISDMNKSHNIEAYNNAIEVFNMLNSIEPNYKDCTENIQKCKENIEKANVYLEKCIEEEGIKKQKVVQVEEKRKIEEDKARAQINRKENFKKIAILFIVVLIIVGIIIGIISYINNRKQFEADHQVSDISINILSKTTSFEHQSYYYDENGGDYSINFNCSINNGSGATIDYISVTITVYNLFDESQGVITSSFGSTYLNTDVLGIDSDSSKNKTTRITESSPNGDVSIFFAYLYSNNLSNMRFSYEINTVYWADGEKHFS